VDVLGRRGQMAALERLRKVPYAPRQYPIPSRARAKLPRQFPPRLLCATATHDRVCPTGGTANSNTGQVIKVEVTRIRRLSGAAAGMSVAVPGLSAAETNRCVLRTATEPSGRQSQDETFV